MAAVKRLSYEPAAGTDNANHIKYNTDYYHIAQGFTTGAAIDNVSKVVLQLKKVGSPTGTLTLTIQTNSSGFPSGSVITNGTANTVAESGLSTSYGNIDFTFTTPPDLAAGTLYHIVLVSNRAASTSNYVNFFRHGDGDAGDDYTAGEYSRQNSASTWFDMDGDAYFEVWGDPAPSVSKMVTFI